MALAAWTLTLACVSGNKIRVDADTVSADIDRARRSGAQRCAPTELATAEANLNFARGELSQGNSYRASEHISEAEDAVRRALALSRDCGSQSNPQRNQQVVVQIEETDRDGDGVPDKDDKCPDQPEDRDGFQDEDGCPDPDNDGDGVLDLNDRCPLIPGPASNQGCPLNERADRDGDGVPDGTDKCPDVKGSAENAGCPDGDRDGDGVADRLDKCPEEAGPVKNEGCPILDRDGDGIADDVDKCPDEPEDKDGFQDEDGCPDLDNDGDGIPDLQDKCPNEAGSREDEGCPRKYKLVVVKRDRIEIKEQIKFKATSAKIIGAGSVEILGEVAQALKDNPRIKRVRVEGHTDSMGNDAANLRLSQLRADAVKAALVRLGVSGVRLDAVGYGETRPVASNTTAVGRAENRRTELNIVEQ